MACYAVRDISDNSVELCGVLERGADHFEGWDLGHFFASLKEVETIVAADFPSDGSFPLPCLLLVLVNEGHELLLGVNHEHLLHVGETQAVVRSLG